jgi:dTDP-4-dehydrorhamnose 3,5-epimerase
VIFSETILKGCFVIDLKPFQDDRGWFSRTYCKDEFKSIGYDAEFVQLNHSFTNNRGTIRGMHYQIAPFKEIKLVRCISGNIFDVIIDLRFDSPTFLKWIGVELSSENKKMILIPEGFAHGFQSLSNNAELIYHHSAFYTPNSEGGLRYDDESLNIDWPLAVSNISERDKNHPLITKEYKGI